ncbi:Gfo/Idh/MocA family oxidoreductase [Streptomyces sp. NPDC026589]|uniref:Gfo/Idh/MocA family protein n=1 Tax=Streptomyces sp. NPDC026589 TaxID=3155609 RepID=UPI0033D5673A
MPRTGTTYDGRPLRALLVGTGQMGLAWLRTLAAHPGVTLAGLVDLDERRALGAAIRTGNRQVPIAARLLPLAHDTAADFVINTASPDAHHALSLEALEAALPVLSEKPLAATLPQAVQLTALSSTTGVFLMVAQNRYHHPQLTYVREQVRRLGSVGLISCEFLRAPRFGGFRDSMAHPLLLDMAVHAFDTARDLAGGVPLSVQCEEFNPPWSWYAGAAGACATFTFDGGTRFAYTGSWCSPGLETSWNGHWRVSAERGSVRWDGTTVTVQEAATGGEDPTEHTDGTVAQEPGGLREVLDDFLTALRTGSEPWGACRNNLLSTAMPHAAVAAARGGHRVLVADVLAAAAHDAARDAPPHVAEALAAWRLPEPAASVSAGA